ncbi:Nucleotidyltransferase [Aspergillus ibericus CBS 121593]|uniref:Nucleotidyltransferase n=1 Tax=Aspergillus ibericus CBS 121593 TaxID=1448316 RepID=A0A395H3Z7_9EURO|nr:Nucleotidyltransferase [Aspergillus ibericus CBS 121593]RAL02343.1 Nucleotidyltransferase [Aspergillus ibericus CBS 121593]
MSEAPGPSTEEAGRPSPSFSSCPPIFVLPTHLSLELLHETEANLIKRDARLTYDISEARLVLGKIGQEKRAALELRSRGLWTEPISNPEPPRKRRRVVREPEKPAGQADIDLSTETEDEEDGMKSRHDPSRHLNRPKSRSPAESTFNPSEASSVSSTIEQPDIIKVVKLDWLDQCLKAQELLPIDPYIIYIARQVPRPEPPKTTIISSDIIQRAKQDAALRPPTPTRHHPRTHDPARNPPKLYRTTTSENDDTVPIPPAPDWVTNHVLYACLRSAPLHPPNEAFINQLIKIRQIRELTLDEIGVRAYSTSIAAIAAYPYEFRRPSEILALPGCDTKIANLFHEYQQSPTGTLSAAALLDTDPTLHILHTFYNIWGVGAKTARDFHYARHWTSLDDIIEHGWSSLTRVQQIGLKYYDEFLAGIPRPEVQHIAHIVTHHANLARPPPNPNNPIQCIITGGYRRGKTLCGDVDLILTHPDETITKTLIIDVVAALESAGWITHTLALHLITSHRDQQTLPYRAATSTSSSTGDNSTPKNFDTLDKALVVWQDPHFTDPDPDPTSSPPHHHHNHNPNPHRRVDIIISPWRTIGCAVLGWSGDKTFERDLRRYVKKTHGWKFDSSGVRDRNSGGRVIDLEGGGRTWEERERLHDVEIKQAALGQTLVERGDLVCRGPGAFELPVAGVIAWGGLVMDQSR